jgi:hypothetical protein
MLPLGYLEQLELCQELCELGPFIIGVAHQEGGPVSGCEFSIEYFIVTTFEIEGSTRLLHCFLDIN